MASDMGMDVGADRAVYREVAKQATDVTGLPVHEALAIHDRTLGTHGEALNVLDNVIEELTDRIKPVLAPSEPVPPAGGALADRETQPAPQHSSVRGHLDDLTYQLTQRTDNVERLTRRLRDVINRLEV